MEGRILGREEADAMRPSGSRRSRKEVERMTRISETIWMVITR